MEEEEIPRRKTKRRSIALVVTRRLLAAVLRWGQRRAGNEVVRRLVAKGYVLSNEAEEIGEKIGVSEKAVKTVMKKMEENLIITRVPYDDYNRKVLGLPKLGHGPPIIFIGNFAELAKDCKATLHGLEILAEETMGDSLVDLDETDWIWVQKFAPKLRKIRKKGWRKAGRGG